MEEYYEGLGKFSSHTRFEVGDGSKVRFWHDMWCEVPDLYGIACIKDVSVAIHLGLYSGSI